MSILDLDSDVLEKGGNELLLNEQAKEIFGDRAFVVKEMGRWVVKSMEFFDRLVINMESETVKDFFDKISYISIDAGIVAFQVTDTLYCRDIPYWRGRILAGVYIYGTESNPGVIGNIKDRLEFKDVLVAVSCPRIVNDSNSQNP